MKGTFIFIGSVVLVSFVWFASLSESDRKSLADNPSVENTLDKIKG